MVIRSPATPSCTIYAVHTCNQQAPLEAQSHKKPSKYTINSTEKTNPNILNGICFTQQTIHR